MAFVYGGLLLGSTGGATYSFLLHREQRAQGAPLTLPKGALFGLVAALPYLIVDTAGSLLSDGWHMPIAVIWQDVVVAASCAALGGLLAFVNQPSSPAQKG